MLDTGGRHHTGRENCCSDPRGSASFRNRLHACAIGCRLPDSLNGKGEAHFRRGLAVALTKADPRRMSAMLARGVVGTIVMLVVADGAYGGQEIRATVTGRVTDQQGAVLPGVTVTATDVDTNGSVETVTGANGGYTISQLQPGPYKVTAALQGFKTFIREGVTLHTAETAKVDIQLSLGALEETITVVA